MAGTEWSFVTESAGQRRLSTPTLMDGAGVGWDAGAAFPAVSGLCCDWSTELRAQRPEPGTESPELGGQSPEPRT